MTIAWYGHLKYKESPLWTVIFLSWGIAFIEYCFQVPANRYGHGQFSAAQLKTIQEVITLLVFCVFSVVYLKEGLRWNYLVGFSMWSRPYFSYSRSGRVPVLSQTGGDRPKATTTAKRRTILKTP